MLIFTLDNYNSDTYSGAVVSHRYGNNRRFNYCTICCSSYCGCCNYIRNRDNSSYSCRRNRSPGTSVVLIVVKISSGFSSSAFAVVVTDVSAGDVVFTAVVVVFTVVDVCTAVVTGAGCNGRFARKVRSFI